MGAEQQSNAAARDILGADAARARKLATETTNVARGRKHTTAAWGAKAVMAQEAASGGPDDGEVKTSSTSTPLSLLIFFFHFNIASCNCYVLPN